MRHEVLHVGPDREVVESPRERGPGGCFLELLLDLMHEGQALLRVELLRLLLDQLSDLLVAVPGIGHHLHAAIVLEELRVRTVVLEAWTCHAYDGWTTELE